MKKTTKGALAAGAAAVLLAGGAGTYAAWTATAPSTTGGTVTTGELTVEQVGTGSWTWATEGAANVGQAYTAGQTIAPGDVLEYTGTYELGIVGTNLTAELVATTSGTGALPAELSWEPTDSPALADLDETDDGTEVTVGGTLTFLDTATGTMNQTINIGDVAVTLKQTAPATAP